MRDFLIALAGITALGLVALYLNYGAVMPCGILKKKIMAEAMKDAFSPRAGDDSFSRAGRGLGVSLGGTMIDRFVDGLTPLECFRLLENGVDMAEVRPTTNENAPWNPPQ